MKPVQLILFPFAVLYDVVTRIRNKLYDLELKPSASFDLPVISVGNIRVGGTGKTPMIEHLIRLLSPRYKVAVLSRGYMRKSSGFRVATAGDNASTIGDEPFQIFRKYSDKAIVAVGEDRAMAIPQILHEFPETDAILLDDAFQHRKVKASFQILLTDYHQPFYDDLLLPAGRLRESKEGARRADAVVVTKCPHSISDDEMMAIQKKISDYSQARVFFAMVRNADFVPLTQGKFDAAKAAVLVTGIANGKQIFHAWREELQIRKHFEFGDHHHYSDGDIKSINTWARNENAVVVTTEKDAVKLMRPGFESLAEGINWFYRPMEVEFIKNGKEFDELVLNEILHARH